MAVWNNFSLWLSEWVGASGVVRAEEDEAEFCMHVVDEEEVFKEDLKVSLKLGILDQLWPMDPRMYKTCRNPRMFKSRIRI